MDRGLGPPGVVVGGAKMKQPDRDRLYYRRWFVLLMLFAALGPLAIPLLWRSPHFSVGWKAILTVAVLALTAVLVWILGVVVLLFLEQLREIRELRAF